MMTEDRRKSLTYTGSDSKTLMQTHEYLVRVRQERKAPDSEWLAYYRRLAMLYA